MANRLTMAKVNDILTLHEQGWSQRRIARELQVDRETVGRYVSQGETDAAEAPPGSKPAKAPPGSNGSESAQAPTGSRSACAPYRELIEEKLRRGLSAQRIFQDLAGDHGFTAKYHSVRRFVRWLQAVSPLPFRRMEQPAGEEAQVDFGRGAPIVAADGKRRQTWVFRIVLSHSRKAYSEAVHRQTTENFIRCLENAFHYFGGVPKTLVIDNLRAAVTKADWYEPVIHPKLAAFCRHYGTVILPTKPYTPRHKGKVESGVKYVKNNCLKARTFETLDAQNRCLLDWEQTTADTRIHGTTRQQVGKLFDDIERAALTKLPTQRFPFFHEAQRAVHRDGHVEVAKAYYSVPCEYVTRRVWVRWDGRLVRIFNHRWEQIALHAQREPGRFSTESDHIAAEKISGVERGAAHLLEKAAWIGEETARWSQAMLVSRGIAGIRVLIGLLSLTRQHPPETIERACGTAATYQAYRLRTVRELLKRQAPRQRCFEFIEEHELIRPLSEYGQLVSEALRERGF